MPKKKDNPKNRFISFACTSQEANELKKRANKAKLSTAQFVHSCVFLPEGAVNISKRRRSQRLQVDISIEEDQRLNPPENDKNSELDISIPTSNDEPKVDISIEDPAVHIRDNMMFNYRGRKLTLYQIATKNRVSVVSIKRRVREGESLESIIKKYEKHI